MKNIYGDPSVIKAATEAVPGDKTVYVNMEALNELSDEFEAIITEIKINIERDFSDVGNNTYMPNPELMYEIANARGISGGENSITESISEEVNINPMLCKNLEDPPTLRKMVVGKKVVKYSTVLEEDGSLRHSSPCSSQYNVWERCCELWAKEEMYSEDYTKKTKYPTKYENRFKRKYHFQSELKFAHAKAETKAYLKTIRELAGLMTGYKIEDLKRGSLIFSKIRRNRKILKAETAAKLTALSNGFKQPPQDLLFGSPTPEKPPTEPTTPEPISSDPEKKLSKIETMRNTLTLYLEKNVITPADSKAIFVKILNWLKSAKEKDSNFDTFWNKALVNLELIEKEIEPSFKVSHNLY